MGGGQNAACNLEERRVLISAFKAGEDRQGNLTLISILSSGEGEEKGGHQGDGESE